MDFLKERDISERRSCEFAGISRSSLRYEPHTRDERDLVDQAPGRIGKVRYGYWRAWTQMRRQGFEVNHKRVYRVWKQEGLALAGLKRRRRGKKGAVPLRAEYPQPRVDL